jgi:isopropylmalate/homocitrate/citramalate synthase
VSRREHRFLRRLAERRQAAIEAADPRHVEDRRQAERRTESLTGEQLDARLRELGITTDRRQGQRRQHRDRRRR